MSERKGTIYLLLILSAAFSAYLVGNGSVSLWDRDEPRYAECSREMLRGGDWVLPRYLGHWRVEKPPLIYWCQMTAMAVFGQSGFAARLPSAMAAALAGIVLAVVVRRVAGVERAVWSTLIFCTAFVSMAAAKFCITDAVMLLFITTGQACLLALWISRGQNSKSPRSESTGGTAKSAESSLAESSPTKSSRAESDSERSTVAESKSVVVISAESAISAETAKSAAAAFEWPAVIVLWATIALAGLTKGPQVLGMHIVMLLTLACLEVINWRSRQSWLAAIAWWKSLRLWIGLPIIAVITGPWLILIHLRAPGFVEGLLIKAGRHTATSMEGHGEWPGYYVVEIFWTFFPWCLFLPTAVGLAWRHRREPAIRFAVAATVGPWLMMEMVRTKLPFYILPAFPPLAYLTADALVRCIRREYLDFTRPIFGAAVAVWGACCVAIGLAPWLLILRSQDVPAGILRSLTIQWVPWAQDAPFYKLPCGAMDAFTIVATIYAFTVALIFHFRKVAAGAAAMGIGSLALLIVLYGWLLPHLSPLNLSVEAAADLQRAGGGGATKTVIMIDYKEPSMAFYQGGGAREADDGYLSRTPPSDWARWIVTTEEEWTLVPRDLRRQYKIIGQHYGLMYAGGGRTATVLVLERRDPIAEPTANGR
jgi:4-amino-4-deoxy-L-arabinose transferase-like glycosyltransferase